MGLFDGVDVDFDEVQEYSAGLAPGTYSSIVSNVTTEEKDSGTYLVITYTVTEGPSQGKTHREYNRIIKGQPQTEQEINNMRFIKTRMLSLGVPAERINSVEPEDIEGTEVALTVDKQKNNPRYMQVVRVDVLSPVTESTPSSLPTAAKPAAAAGDITSMFS